MKQSENHKVEFFVASPTNKALKIKNTQLFVARVQSLSAQLLSCKVCGENLDLNYNALLLQKPTFQL